MMPYVKQDTLERRVEVTKERLGYTQQEWNSTLAEILESESARVEQYTNQSFREGQVPPQVKEAVIRLCRVKLQEIRVDGISNESTGDGASYTYKDPAQIREDVREELRKSDFSVKETRVSLI